MKHLWPACIAVLLLAGAGVGGWAYFAGQREKAANAPRAYRIPVNLKKSDYRDPLDELLLKNVSGIEQSKWLRMLDREVVKRFHEDVMNGIRARTSIEITDQQFRSRPALHRAIRECAEILKIRRPRVFVTQGFGVNAYTANWESPIIVLTAGLLRVADDEELRFVIGHEMGHIACGHVRWQTYIRLLCTQLPTAGKYLLNMAILKWNRSAEYSADNAGLVCVQDPAIARRALARIVIGLPAAMTGDIDIPAFLDQRRETEDNSVSEFVIWVNQTLQTHPWIPDRMEQIAGYAGSGRYQNVWEPSDVRKK